MHRHSAHLGLHWVGPGLGPGPVLVLVLVLEPGCSGVRLYPGLLVRHGRERCRHRVGTVAAAGVPGTAPVVRVGRTDSAGEIRPEHRLVRLARLEAQTAMCEALRLLVACSVGWNPAAVVCSGFDQMDWEHRLWQGREQLKNPLLTVVVVSARAAHLAEVELERLRLRQEQLPGPELGSKLGSEPEQALAQALVLGIVLGVVQGHFVELQRRFGLE